MPEQKTELYCDVLYPHTKYEDDSYYLKTIMCSCKTKTDELGYRLKLVKKNSSYSSRA